MQLLGERWSRRDRQEGKEPADLVGCRGHEVAVPGQQLGGVVHVVQHRPGEDCRDRMAPERERRDDAEVPAAATQRPEEVGLAFGVGLDDRTVGEDDLRRDEAVYGQPERAGEVPHTAAERQSADAGGADDPDGNRKPVLVCRLQHVLEKGPAADARHLRARVDLDRVHFGQVDHEPVVDRAEAATVVAAAPHCDPQPVLDAVAHGRDHIRLVEAVGDRRRPLVDHRVVQRARLVVVRGARLHHPSFDSRRQALDRNSHLFSSSLLRTTLCLAWLFY